MAEDCLAVAFDLLVVAGFGRTAPFLAYFASVAELDFGCIAD